MPKPIFMKLRMSIMATEPISTACFINTSNQSVCVSFLSSLGNGSLKYIPPFRPRQCFGKHVPAATNTLNNRIIVGRVCVCVCPCIPLLLLGNNTVKTQQQRRIFGGVLFCVVRVVSKESTSENFLF